MAMERKKWKMKRGKKTQQRQWRKQCIFRALFRHCYFATVMMKETTQWNITQHFGTIHIYIQQQFEKRTTLNALIQNFINGNAYIKTHWQCSFNHHHCHCIKDGGRPEPVPILPKTPSPENGPLLWFTIQHFNNCPLNILVHWESFFFSLWWQSNNNKQSKTVQLFGHDETMNESIFRSYRKTYY